MSKTQLIFYTGVMVNKVDNLPITLDKNFDSCAVIERDTNDAMTRSLATCYIKGYVVVVCTEQIGNNIHNIFIISLIKMINRFHPRRVDLKFGQFGMKR